MGALTSRQNADVEETDVSANHAYRYPPKSGNYFGSHFIMGGERFDTPQPEAYLFGENADLNFLGSRPTVFPYPPPQTIEPTRTLKSLVNIRKESVRFTKIVDTTDSATKTTTPIIAGTTLTDKLSGTASPIVAPLVTASYNIEFVYDADARCAITIYYFCTEEVTSSGCSYVSREPTLTSETFHCSSGVNQMFSQTSHSFQPHLFADDDLYYHTDRDLLPVVIHCVVEEGTDDPKQSHTTICVVDHHTDGTYVLRALKQKIFVDGLCYLLQEIYGIENKNIHKVSAMADDDTDDNGSECVICMCDTRDTLILPCRHLCLCNSCADSLRYQANNCPICRAPFRALLQIKAVRRKGAMAGIAGCGTAAVTATSGGGSVSPPSGGAQQANAGEHIPSGYMAVSLIEALNGPPQMRMCEPKIDEHATQAAESLNRSKDATDTPDSSSSRPSEIHMSVLSSKDATPTSTVADVKNKTSPSTVPSKTAGAAGRTAAKHATKQQQQQLRDTLKIINEKMSAAVAAAADSTADADEDSDAEKLSPLLDKRQKLASQTARISEKIASQSTADLSKSLDADESNDGINQPTALVDDCAAGETEALAGTATDDSDYYTPEEPQTTILSPLCPPENFDGDAIAATDAAALPNNTNVNNASSTQCLTTAPSQMATSVPAVSAAIKDEHRSLPDSPVSGNSTISTRSSGDSYSSGSSTRQLLATVNGQQPAQSQQQSSGSCADDNALLLKSTTIGGGDGTANGAGTATAVHV